MKNLLPGLLLVGLFGCTSAFADFADEEAAEIQEYIDIFQGQSIQKQKDICNRLQWKGISDARLYDVIQVKLETILASTDRRIDRDQLETAAWYAKGLGSSGMEKYLGTLRKMASKNQRKLVRYANEGIDKIGIYKEWNPIISNRKNFREGESLQDNRFANMLKSDDWNLKIIAVKRIHYDHIYNEYLLDILRDELLKSYHTADTNSLRVDGFKWMVKSLAGSRNEKYYNDLKNVENSVKHRKLRAYTAKMIRGYYDKK